MTTLCYNLATHKNVQEKLIEEIDTIETIDHDTIADLHYLEAAINENLRMYPPAHVQERVCKKNTELKGRYIIIALWARKFKKIQAKKNLWNQINQFHEKIFFD